MDNEQFNKLPKFARDEINKLRADLERADKQLREISNPDAQIVFDDWPNGRRIGLGSGESVSFHLVAGQKHPYVEVSIRDGALKVLCDSGLSISPEATNAISIGPGIRP